MLFLKCESGQFELCWGNKQNVLPLVCMLHLGTDIQSRAWAVFACIQHRGSSEPALGYKFSGLALLLCIHFCWDNEGTNKLKNIQTVQVLPVMLLMSVTVSARDLTGFEQLIDKRTTWK